ncbi:hypothetical protein BIWAKO_05725 [Bosea sp. BIWAKO-01]|nr:hypothetical protein BIWAKO_05725 [Bosea sp. BIWAKO-01]
MALVPLRPGAERKRAASKAGQGTGAEASPVQERRRTGT